MILKSGGRTTALDNTQNTYCNEIGGRERKRKKERVKEIRKERERGRLSLLQQLK